MNLVIIYLFIPVTSLDDELIKTNWCCWEKIDLVTDTVAILEYCGMPKGELAQYLHALSDASISDRAHAPWASHNTP